jgi:hypothetical protein
MNREDTPAAKSLPVAPPVRINRSWQGPTAAISTAVSAIKANPNPYIFYVILQIIVELVITLIVKRPLSDRINDRTIAAIAVGLINLFLLPYLTNYSLQILQKSKFSLKQFFRLSPKKVFNVWLVYLMLIVMSVASLILLFIPLIWLLPWAYLVVYPVVDQDYSPVQSLKYIRQITKGNLSKVWAIIGIYFVVSIILTLVPVIGRILGYFLDLVFYATIAVVYVWLKHNYQTPVDTEN